MATDSVLLGIRCWSDSVRSLGICVRPAVLGDADATGMDYARNAFVTILESSKTPE